MKKFILIIIVLSLNHSNAQTDSSQFKKWSASVYGGLFFGQTSSVNYNRTGNVGVDISYNYTPYFAVYISGAYNFLNNTNNQFYHSTTGLLESTTGVKFYADTAFFKLFIETGFGYYQRLLHYSDAQYSYTDNDDGLGINFGMGADFKLDRKINFIIKGKLHFTNVILNGNSLFFAGLYSGIKYSF